MWVGFACFMVGGFFGFVIACCLAMRDNELLSPVSALDESARAERLATLFPVIYDPRRDGARVPAADEIIAVLRESPAP